MKKGYVQIYTGAGKGKTTASLGLAVRAVGAGMRVLMVQFMKGRTCCEHEGLKLLGDAVTVEQYGREMFVVGNPTQEDTFLAAEGLNRAREALSSDHYGVVILDEACTAIAAKVIEERDLLSVLAARSGTIEVILTGREATQTLIDAADLVTEMVEIKHYFSQGQVARKGIEE